MAAKQYTPLTNITIPVFNRYAQTLNTIAALRQNTNSNIIITVVDNGSESALKKELIRLHQKKVIDNLFILEKNYGVSCACNIGWELVDAPFFMKLDNDMITLSNTWIEDLFALWNPHRHSTILGPVWNSAARHLRVDSPRGTMWMMPESFSGAALLVSKKISEQIGRFSEDYGLYGEEDADYCMRCHHAGIKKFTFEASGIFEHIGGDDDYKNINFLKTDLHNKNVGTSKGEGIFAFNLFLYQNGIRSLKVGRKYAIEQVNGNYVKIAENKLYIKYLDILSICCDLFNACGRKPDEHMVKKIKYLLASV